MAAPVGLTARDFDAWHLASPLQLLHLIKRLGVEGTVIATWLGVKPAAVSQWHRGRRDIPLRYAPGLRVWAEQTLAQAEQRTRKEMDRQPTPELREAVWAEFAGIWHRWKLEVLHQADTLRKVAQQHYATLGQVLTHDPLTRADRDMIAEVSTDLSGGRGSDRRPDDGDPDARGRAAVPADGGPCRGRADA